MMKIFRCNFIRGSEKADKIASKKIKEIKELVGF